MEPWIQTYDGKDFWPEKPDHTKVDIGTIARVLARIPRFGGHTKYFYSVGSHSIHVSNLVPNDLKLPALLHDAHEVYSGFGDVVGPVKQLFPRLAEIESQIDEAIARSCGFLPTLFDHWAVKQADLQMLATEKKWLMVEEPISWNVELPEPLGRPCEFGDDTPDLFLELFWGCYRTWTT